MLYISRFTFRLSHYLFMKTRILSFSLSPFLMKALFLSSFKNFCIVFFCSQGIKISSWFFMMRAVSRSFHRCFRLNNFMSDGSSVGNEVMFSIQLLVDYLVQILQGAHVWSCMDVSGILFCLKEVVSTWHEFTAWWKSIHSFMFRLMCKFVTVTSDITDICHLLYQHRIGREFLDNSWVWSSALASSCIMVCHSQISPAIV